MLTRLRVDGFKSLVGVDVRFGPFTCIAGPNGAGKSNLFDAITFLKELMDRPLVEAALAVRGEGEPVSDPRGIFHHVAGDYVSTISFDAEMIVPAHGIDSLGQKAEAKSTFLRYRLQIAHRPEEPEDSQQPGSLEIREESLEYITAGKALQHLPFPHTQDWKASVIRNSRRSQAGYISTESAELAGDGAPTHIKLHQDGVQGIPKRFVARNLPRTVLSSVNALESPTALLARREIQSWQLLQLEPSALRRSDPYRVSPHLTPSGGHLAATLARLAGRRLGQPASRHNPGGSNGDREGRVYAEVANRLTELIEGVGTIAVDDDPRRELLTVVMTDRSGTRHPAWALSDGTLRFLALATLEQDPEVQGTLCLEEPENGIHPARIPAMLRLLQEIATDASVPVGPDNTLRQVILNTHAPAVVAQVPDDSLLCAGLVPQKRAGIRFLATTFEWLPGTWRARVDPGRGTMPKGRLLAYLSPLEPRSGSGGRVVDREDLQPLLPYPPAPSAT